MDEITVTVIDNKYQKHSNKNSSQKNHVSRQKTSKVKKHNLSSSQLENYKKAMNQGKDFSDKSLLGTFKAPVIKLPLSPAKILVIGGGVSGLTSAYDIVNGKRFVTVFEANEDEVGGRCKSGWFRTIDGLYKYGHYFEKGGELFDRQHNAIKQLARDLGLQLIHAINSEEPGSERLLFFAEKTLQTSGEVTHEMRQMTEVEAVEAFKVLWGKGNGSESLAKRDYNDVSYPWLAYPDISTVRSRELDDPSTNMAEYFDHLKEVIKNLEGVDLENFFQLLKVLYNVEWSGEPDEMSPLDFHSLGPTQGPGKFRYWGLSDESKKVVGGNQQICFELQKRINVACGLKNGITEARTDNKTLGVMLGHRVTKVKREGMKVKVWYAINGVSQIEPLIYDRIVLAVPPPIYRNNENVGVGKLYSWYLDMSESGISNVKKLALETVGFGAICKTNFQVNSQSWKDTNWNGEVVATTKYANYTKADGTRSGQAEINLTKEEQCQQVWEVTRGQTAPGSVLTAYWIGEKATVEEFGSLKTGRMFNGQIDTVDEGPYEISLWQNDPVQQQQKMDRILSEFDELTTNEGVNLGQIVRNELTIENGVVKNSYYNKSWNADENQRGAFVYYAPGQESFVHGGFAGIEPLAEPLFADALETIPLPVLERNIHFGGSSTDYDWNGWIEGACRGGHRVASEVLSACTELGHALDF